MSETIVVKLETIDGERILNIPPEFEFEYDDAVIRKDGNRLIIEPAFKARPSGSFE